MLQLDNLKNTHYLLFVTNNFFLEKKAVLFGLEGITNMNKIN